jgi:cell division ATPase FtsA
MKDVCQLFSYNMGMEVHLGSPGQHLGKGMIDEVRNPMYSTAIGLVMMGFDSAQKHGSEFEPNVKIDANPSAKKVANEATEAVVEMETPQSQDKPKGPWDKYKGLFNGLQNWLSEDDDDFKSN